MFVGVEGGLVRVDGGLMGVEGVFVVVLVGVNSVLYYHRTCQF